MLRKTSIRGTSALVGAACLAATPALAQDAGQRLSFGVEQRFEIGRNTDLSTPAEGTSASATTLFTFGLVDETPLQRVAVDASIGLVIEDTPDTAGTEVDIGSPGVELTYTREVPDASLSLGVNYIRDDVADLAEDLADADADGTQTDFGAIVRYETFRTAPASLFLEAEFDRTEYEDTTDPGLIDTDTTSFLVGSNLRFSDVLTGTVSAGRSREEDAAGAVTITDTLEAGLVYAMANGSASLTLGREAGDDETRTTLTAGRVIETATGSLAVLLGVSHSDIAGNDVVGAIDWTGRLGGGELTVSLDRTVSYDATIPGNTTDTAIGAVWSGSLSDVDTLAINLGWELSESPAERIEEKVIGATWGRAITDRASFDVGMSYRVRDDAGGRAASPLVFVAIGQTF